MTVTPQTALHDQQLLSRFLELDSFLLAWQSLWRPKPFTHLQLPWESEHPQLAHWLRQRTLEQAEDAHTRAEPLAAPAPFAHLALEAARLSEVAPLPASAMVPVQARMSADVPGRKWQQIEAFASCLNFNHGAQHWLDWCAGKGHLGRRLLQPGQQLTCLEHDPALIASGKRLSERLHLAAAHVHQDVMAVDAAQRLHACHTPVALHACGDLHVQLMRLASDAGCRQLAIAPCCYNRIDAPDFQPLSQAGHASALKLSRDELGLPLSETVTAGARVRRQRDESMARRLGFDLLQRQSGDSAEYLPTPSLPSAWLHKSFADYCRDLAALKNLPPFAEQDWGSLEAAGWARLAQVRNLEQVRNLFRRPLELWLVLERALYLREQGYSVTVGTFCAHQTTPRNLLLIAQMA